MKYTGAAAVVVIAFNRIEKLQQAYTSAQLGRGQIYTQNDAIFMSQKRAFDEVFPDGTIFKPAVEDNILSSFSNKMKIQSAFWKFSLLIRNASPEDMIKPSVWAEVLKRQRTEYAEIKAKYLKPAPALDCSVDPLEINSEKSAWSEYYADESLKTELRRDIRRLFQDNPFFLNEGESEDPNDTLKNPNLRKICDILFLHLKANPTIVYQQGYHDLCGVVYYLMKTEMKARLQESTSTEYFYSLMFDRDDIAVEADTFWIYSKLVEYLAPLYAVGENAEQTITKCEYIQSTVLKGFDKELSERLVLEEIHPFYMISWLRLMFAGMYDMDSALTIWSKIFIFMPDVTIIDVMASVILTSKRKEILEAETMTDILSILSKFKDPPNVEQILNVSVNHMKRMTTNNNRDNKTESLCSEIEKWLDKCETAPKDEVISALSTFRDALKAIMAKHSETMLDSYDGLFSNSTVADVVDVEDPDTAVDDSPILPLASQKATSVDIDILTVETTEKKTKKLSLSRKDPF